ncbi:MAG: AAA family ATPase [Treponema sp.]|nr:AAA family ATPase [Treponema sp.]
MILILTGPKHSGKTSVGLALSKITGGDFIDVDALIEKLEGVSARELYRQSKDIFQKAEFRAISTIQAKEETGNPVIVAAGGGLIDNDAAIKVLAKDGRVLFVYLEVSAATAWERIEQAARDGGGLPAFLDVENPQASHELLHERRAAAYKKQAGIVINAEGKTPRQLAAECFPVAKKVF